MHAKSESDVTSLAPSSPPRSPKRAVYYVQSPSRDSHDGDKSSTMHATPVYNSPMESPSHPSYGRHSRTSSASRFSGTFRSWSGRKGHRGAAAGGGGNKRNNDKGWPECKVIQEEGPYDEFDDDKAFTRRCQIMMAFLVFVLFFTALCLIIWGATRQYTPDVVVKSLSFDDFYAGEGTDHTGVPTKMVTVNCSLIMTVYNPAPTFGVHVRSSSIDLFYSKIPVATGQLEKHYIPKKSRRAISVLLQSEKVPLYGAGAGLTLSNTGGIVPLTLDFDIVTRGYVVGKLVRTTHRKHVFCKVSVDSTKNKPIKFSRSTCTYT